MSSITGQSLQIELMEMGLLVGFQSRQEGGFSSKKDQQSDDENSQSDSSNNQLNNSNTWATSTATWLQTMIENNYMQLASSECSFGLKVFCPTLCYNLSSIC